MTDFEWDRHIAVTSRGDGTFDADLTDGWLVGGGVNGGYLLSTIGNALGQVAPGKPDPIAVSAYYLSASVPGPGDGVDPRAPRRRQRGHPRGRPDAG